MANIGQSANKILIAIFLILIVVCIYLLVSSTNKKDNNRFKDVGPFQQYWLDPYAYNPYFAKDIYIVPGSGNARLAHNVNTKDYDNSYLPYESAIPAVDVLRANNQKNNSILLPPSYYTQVIRHNTTPFSEPIIKSI